MYYLAIAFYLWRDGWSPREWAPRGIDLIDVAATVSFTNVWRDSAINSVVPGDWSVGNEMTFYLLLPMILSVGRRSFTGLLALASAAMALAVGYVAFRTPAAGMADTLAFEFPPALQVFLFGVITAFLIQKKSPRRFPPWAALAILLSATFVVPQFGLGGNVAVYALLYCLLCYGLHGGGASLVANAAAARIGVVSFSVYLIHFALIGPLTAASITLTANRGVPLLVLAYSLVAATAFAISLATHRFVEAPFIRLAASFPRKPSKEA